MDSDTALEQQTALADTRRRPAWWFPLLRGLVLLNVACSIYYLGWRYLYSINWQAWWIALPLLAAETYSVIDSWLFGLMMWRIRRSGEPPAPPPGATADVFITCYNEPVELVRQTAQQARAISWPHKTYVLDDGNSPAMRAMAEQEGVDYVVRSRDWTGKDRHAKAGNVNNALFQTDGEFILILDADQLAEPAILDRTLGYFRDPKVAFVQTPQPFYNVPPGDPFGSHAPLFYGPIQQGKDGWNAAFFCGSNAVLRREALMSVGVRYYVRELEQRVGRALQTSDRLLREAARQLPTDADPKVRSALTELRVAVRDARSGLKDSKPIQEVTWEFQRRAAAVSRLLVAEDLRRMQAELAEIPGLEDADTGAGLIEILDDEEVLAHLTGRAASPLAAIGAVRNLLLSVDVDREDEAQPIMPLSRISVTEDMATAMRLHATGWRSVYHHELLARGLAPEDLRTALQQRLRWAQGTIQTLLRENPLLMRGLSWGQRLMYFATMFSYLSGFFAVIYLAAPLLFFFFGTIPVRSYSWDFFQHLVPFLVVNQLMFVVAAWGLSTWRGQQYSLALFPLWINAVVTAVGNVYFGRKLGFVVTPKTRQGGGTQYRLVRVQLIAMALLVLGIVWGLLSLALGFRTDVVPMLINVVWALYDLALLGVVLRAAGYRSSEPASDPAALHVGVAEVHGRTGAGRL